MYFNFLILWMFVYFQILKMKCWVDKTRHFRYYLLFAFNRGFKCAKASRNICAACRSTTSKYWPSLVFPFEKCKFARKSLITPGSTNWVQWSAIKLIFHEKPHQTTREFSEHMFVIKTKLQRATFPQWTRLRKSAFRCHIHSSATHDS